MRFCRLLVLFAERHGGDIMHPVFTQLMSQKLIITRRTRNTTGNWVNAQEFTVPGFVEYGRKTDVNREGEEIVTTGTVYLRSDAPIDVTHPHWTIQQAGGKLMEVVNIHPIHDPRTSRLHHYEVSVR